MRPALSSKPEAFHLKLGWMPQLTIASLYALITLYRALDTILSGLSRITASEDQIQRDRYLLHPGSDDGEPDATVGVILARADAPDLFAIFEDLGKRLGGVFPSEVRVAYLPACGVVDLSREPGEIRQVLLIGLPCLQIWTVDELRAVLTHELAHLKQDDAVFTREVLQFSSALQKALARQTAWTRWLSPRYLLARLTSSILVHLACPVGWLMEYRADRLAAECVGAEHLASAIQKLAVVQPIFREILQMYDPVQEPEETVYSLFGRVWTRLPRLQYIALLRRLIDQASSSRSEPHPPVIDRLSRLQGRKIRARSRALDAAADVVCNGQELARVLHNHLYGQHDKPPSVFQRSRT